MSIRSLARMIVGAGLLSGCYSSVEPPPLSDDLRLADLSDVEYMEMCMWSAHQEGWPDRRARECVDGDGSYIRGTMSPEMCMMIRLNRTDDPECEATVRQWYECQIAIGDDLCQMNLSECLWDGCRDVVN